MKRVCEGLINISKVDPLVTMSTKDSMFDAAKALVDVHRVVILDEKGNIINILSQMDLLSFLLARHNFLGEHQPRPMTELGLIPSEVVGSLDEDANVMAAMRYMRDCGVSGIAVTNKEGQIITNFSATDLLSITADKFDLLTLSIKDFLLKMHGYLKVPVIGKMTESVDAIMLKMDFYRVHRVYIVDDNMKPQGFVSITDIIRFLTSPKRKQ